MTRRFLWLALILPLLLAGRTTYIGVEQRVVYNGTLRDNSITHATDYASPCTNVGSTQVAGDARVNCYVPEGYTLLIQRISVNAVDVLADGGAGTSEQCELLIETSSTGSATTGTDISTSSIMIGATNPNPVGTCLPAATVVIDGRGESCVRDVDPEDANATIAGGGWFRINPDAPSGGACVGTCTCDLVWSAKYQIVGLLSKGA